MGKFNFQSMKFREFMRDHEIGSTISLSTGHIVVIHSYNRETQEVNCRALCSNSKLTSPYYLKDFAK